MSVELNYIQKVLKLDPEKTGEDLYNDYIRELTWMILQVVKQSCINTENTLLNEALEVVNKMVSNLGYKEFEIIEGSTEFYLKLLKEIAVSYVNSLCQPRYLFPTPRVIWVTENKQAINNLFELYKKLSSYVYEDLFMAIDYALENYINNQKQELIILSNILFLLSELVDRHFLERNVNMNKAKNKEIAILASTVKKASILVQEYANNRQSFQGVKDAEYLDIAVLIFS